MRLLSAGSKVTRKMAIISRNSHFGLICLTPQAFFSASVDG